MRRFAIPALGIAFLASGLVVFALPQSQTLQETPAAASAPSAQAKTPHPGAATTPARLTLEQMVGQLPRRVTSKSGAPGDMVNLLIVGTSQQVIGAFTAAGWVQPDKTPQDAIVHAVQETMAHQAYSEMPISQLYLFGRPQDFSWVNGTPLQIVAERNHFRLWRAPWLTTGGRIVWAGAATHDIGIEKDSLGQLTHRIDPDVDAERDYVLQTLAEAGKIDKNAYLTPSDPVRQGLTATGDAYHSDGRIIAIFLK